ncbi:MAG: T9SS type A sorting domain-containing protein [Bacteroidales bacterium]|nr:T9SS type A sorting domain-containing protein [Bacteroidales bacterium]
MKKAILLLACFATISFTFGQTENSSNPIPEQAFTYEKAILLNDTIWVLDSTLQQRVVDGEFVNQSKRIVMSHDQQGRPTSNFQLTWYSDQQSWKNSNYDSASFHSSGQVFERFGYSWNTNDNNWKITYYFKMLENYQLVEQFQKAWDNNKNKYLHGYHKWTEFDETGLPQQSFWNEFDSISQEFVTDGRTTYFYDENDLNIFTLWEKWDEANQSWNPKSNSEMLYNGEGLLTQRVYQEWSLDSASWQNTSKTLLQYNAAGLNDTYALYSWLPLYDMWYPSYRIIRTYDEQDRIIQSIRQEDGYGDETWINESRVLQHFENGVLSEKRTQNWVSGDWEDKRIELTSYVSDTLIESQTFINYNPYEETYDTSTRWLTIFNERFIPERFLIQAYSQETSEFITTSQWLYYFSPMAPQYVNDVEQLEFAIYPNPSSGIFQLTLAEDAETARFIVSAVDGSIVDEGRMESDKTHIDLSNKAKGVYFVRVISGNNQGVKKIVKF